MPPTEPTTDDYKLIGKDGKPCLRMKANITVKFVYENATSKKSITNTINLLDRKAVVDDNLSDCTHKVLVLRFEPDDDEADPNYLTFSFKETSDGKAWMSDSVEYNFTATIEQFPGLDPEYRGEYSYIATNKLFDQNVDLENSYKCNTNDDIKFNSTDSDHKVDVTLEIAELQVQAYFKGDKEEFGTVDECAADGGKGNKIVPIAVGAALAGLVIVVLIAYLIGRLKNRRQSSYEALS